MAIGPLRVPVRVSTDYVRPGDEERYFPNHLHFLSRDDVLEVWPSGLITHEKFVHNGSVWRLVKRPMAQGNSYYMAVLEEATAAAGNGATSTSAFATPDTAQRLRSMPIDSLSTSHDYCDVSGACDIAPAYANGSQTPHAHHHQHAASLPPPHNGPLAHTPSFHRSATANGNALAPNGTAALRGNGSYNSMALAALPSGQSYSLGPGGVGGFMPDLLAATESPMPLDRYKAFIRLFSSLGRMRESLGLPAPTPGAPAAALASDPAWETPDAQELVRSTLLVGECLAKFGTAEFVEGRNNSSRAITTKDYAKLLRMYLEGTGAIFRDDFIGRLPLALQDDALTVRTLLQTRCETNDMLFTQLVKHVGQEPTTGGAVVYNNSSVTANPTNHMLAAPKTLVNTVSNAWAKADVKRRTQMGAIGAVAVVALFVVKRKLFGGGGGGGGSGRRGGRDDSEWGGGSSRGRSGRVRGGGDLASRLLDERSGAERMAVRFLSACQDELRRASKNDALLRSDWRLGPLRLAPPGSGSVPEGYEPVHSAYCSVGSYVNALEGGPPFPLESYRAYLDRPALEAPSGVGGGGKERSSAVITVVE
ncbi:hypothetical protein HYH03_005084 [Edaphochlamys debaryana]|uniref:Uncharacterized protein n=1 Tax=Edaphochlamys debaryana TaxID=47281 RepID=A0A835YE27_9CHLO|nr:hypothetical protein HYH03_005084 [Edaphochlamys debaryana]|eukprot:KAG2497090.1 hypothetical protein HYH03_005084 [Edaphochlamys debaryana]